MATRLARSSCLTPSRCLKRHDVEMHGDGPAWGFAPGQGFEREFGRSQIGLDVDLRGAARILLNRHQHRHVALHDVIEVQPQGLTIGRVQHGIEAQRRLLVWRGAGRRIWC